MCFLQLSIRLSSAVGAVYDRALPKIDEKCAVIDRAYNAASHLNNSSFGAIIHLLTGENNEAITRNHRTGRADVDGNRRHARAAKHPQVRSGHGAMLQNPDPANWMMWRRTLDSWGYSPLTQINRNNVGQLRVVWTRGLGPGTSQEATPLVYDGVMYIPNPGD